MPKVLSGEVAGAMQFEEGLEQRNGLWFRNRSFSMQYYVIADTTNQEEIEIIEAVGIPPLFYPLMGAFCKKRSAEEQDVVVHPITGVLTTLWIVTCEFDSKVDEQQQQNNSDPTSLLPQISWDAESEEEHVTEDVDGDVIETTAGEPIFIDAPKPRPILNIVRYHHYPFDPDIILDYSLTLNQATFYGAPKGCALMLPITAGEKETINGANYCKVTYRIKFKMKKVGGVFIEDQWFVRLPNIGQLMREFPGAPPKQATDGEGNKITVALDAAGVPLLPGAPPIILEFQTEGYKNFNALSLGPF